LDESGEPLGSLDKDRLHVRVQIVFEILELPGCLGESEAVQESGNAVQRNRELIAESAQAVVARSEG